MSASEQDGVASLSPREMSAMSHRSIITLSAAVAALLASPAQAHHAMGGTTPQSLLEGLLSGLAHPVIGLDHLAFIIAAGVIAVIVGRSLLVTCTLVVASTSGTLIHLAGTDMPFAEVIIAISVLAAGLVVLFWRLVTLPRVALLLPLVGIAHGYAYAESIIGAEQTPLAAYLVGLTVVQIGIAIGAAAGFRAAQDKLGIHRANNVVGGALTCAGLLFTILATVSSVVVA